MRPPAVVNLSKPVNGANNTGPMPCCKKRTKTILPVEFATALRIRLHDSRDGINMIIANRYGGMIAKIRLRSRRRISADGGACQGNRWN